MLDNDILSMAIHIANDVIAFERHRVFMSVECGGSMSEEVWHLRTATGDFPNKKQDRAILRQILGSTRSGPVRTPRFRGKPTIACPVVVETCRACIVLCRSTDFPEFSEDDKVTLERLVSLVEIAHTQERARELMTRLYFMFLHGRTLANTSRPREILDSYVWKAGFVCHPEWHDRMFSDACEPGPHVRVSAKLTTNNDAAMRMQAHSSRPDDGIWTDEVTSVPYGLKDGDSIASHVRETCQPYMTHDYSNDPLAKRVFPDSVPGIHDHISAPIIIGGRTGARHSLPRCVGVLTTESSTRNSYRDEHLHAMGLLASHCAQPLGRALQREGAEREQLQSRRVARAVDSLRECLNLDHVLHEVTSCLRELGYVRALYSSVDHERARISGWIANGKRFEEQDEERFELPMDAKERGCQSVAVNEARYVLVPDPSVGPPLVEPRWVGFNPFGVFPFADAHGVVHYTVLVERDDRLPLTDVDAELLQHVTTAAMDARERIIQADAEAECARIVAGAPSSIQSLAESFAEVLVKRGFVSRARLYRSTRVDSRGGALFGKDHGLKQYGNAPASKFRGFRPCPENVSRFSDAQGDGPTAVLFCRHDGPRSDLPPAELVTTVGLAAFKNVRKLGKGALDEWLEIPVPDSTNAESYKICIDHHGRPRTMFSPTEIRTAANLVQLIASAADTVGRSARLREFAKDGLHAHALRHCIGNVLNRGAYREAVGDLGKELQKLKELTVRKTTKLTVLEEVEYVTRILKRWTGISRVEVVTSGAAGSARLPREGAPLAWILVTLIMNSADALHDQPDPYIKVSVARQRNGRGWSVTVTDNGCGVPDDVAAKLTTAVAQIPSAKGGDGVGLMYAQLAAEDVGWRVDLTQPEDPTVFTISCPEGTIDG